MKRMLLPLIILTSVLASCGQEQTVLSKSKSTQNPLETIGYGLKVVDSNNMTAQSASEDVIVRNHHIFSNGETLDYLTLGDKVVDGDMVLGTKENMEKDISDYQTSLNGSLKAQGAMTNRCTARVWFGGCIGNWEGVRWPKSTDGITYIYYEPLKLSDSNGNYNVIQAMLDIQTATNGKIKFLEDTASSQPYRLYFTEINSGSQSGCWSSVGWQQGRQQINLQKYTNGATCQNSKGIAAHEILHALGMMHEHQRPERDSYITVNYNNLTQKGKDNFWKYWTDDYSYGQNTTYDYCSVMHYSAIISDPTIAVDVNQPVFTTTQNGINCLIGQLYGTVGQRLGLSTLDKQTLNLRYGQ